MKMGTLMAAPFDVQQVKLTGDPVALIQGVMQAINAPSSFDETGAGQYTLSRNGTLLYVMGGTHPPRNTSLVWVDRKGEETAVPGMDSRSHFSPRMSPDQSKVAIAIQGLSRTADI